MKKNKPNKIVIKEAIQKEILKENPISSFIAGVKGAGAGIAGAGRGIATNYRLGNIGSQMKQFTKKVNKAWDVNGSKAMKKAQKIASSGAPEIKNIGDTVVQNLNQAKQTIDKLSQLSQQVNQVGLAGSPQKQAGEQNLFDGFLNQTGLSREEFENLPPSVQNQFIKQFNQYREQRQIETEPEDTSSPLGQFLSSRGISARQFERLPAGSKDQLIKTFTQAKEDDGEIDEVEDEEINDLLMKAMKKYGLKVPPQNEEGFEDEEDFEDEEEVSQEPYKAPVAPAQSKPWSRSYETKPQTGEAPVIAGKPVGASGERLSSSDIKPNVAQSKPQGIPLYRPQQKAATPPPPPPKKQQTIQPQQTIKVPGEREAEQPIPLVQRKQPKQLQQPKMKDVFPVGEQPKYKKSGVSKKRKVKKTNK